MRFRFKGLNGCNSVCDFEIKEGPHERVLVIATEIPDNPGTSVTNAWPILADLLYKEVLNRCKVEPGMVVWVEHYPERRSFSETWDRVFMDWNEKSHSFKMSQDKHPWQHIKPEDLDALIVLD